MRRQNGEKTEQLKDKVKDTTFPKLPCLQTKTEKGRANQTEKS